MREILNLLEKENWEVMDDKEIIAIYNATTWEEKEEYDAIIQLFVENEKVKESDLKVAVSFFYMKLNLLERNLIWSTNE